MIFLVSFFEAFLKYDIIRYALYAGLLIGILAPLIGSVVVIRRLSFIADTLSHFSLAGVCFGVYLAKLISSITTSFSLDPTILGIIFSVIGTLLIEKLRGFYKNYKELSMPIVMSLGVALSGIFIAASGGSASNLTNSLLFGSLYTISVKDLIFMICFTIFVLIFILIYYQQVIVLCFDETYAKISGINVKGLQLFITIILALFISIFMEIIGVLLISALMIIPVASSILIGKSFKDSCFLSIIFSEISVVFGIIISYSLSLSAGSVIVLINIVILIVIMVITNSKHFINKKTIKS